MADAAGDPAGSYEEIRRVGIPVKTDALPSIDHGLNPKSLAGVGDAPLIIAVRLACVGLLGYWALILVRPFLAIAVWSVVLATATYPVYDKVTAALNGHRRVAAIIITLLGLVVVVGPASWLGLSLADNVRTLSERLGDGAFIVPTPPESVKAWPLLGEKVYQVWLLASTNMKLLFAELAPQLKPLGGRLLGMAGSAGINLLKFILAVVIAGFLFIPGRGLVVATKNVLRHVASDRGDEFIDIAGATIRNVARGVIGISLLQALLGGIGLLLAGVPAAGLLSFLIFLTGIIQIGPSIVIVPAIIWFWFTADTASALIFTLYMIPVMLLDNVLRPLVIGHGLNTPMPVILIGVLGGTITHGLIGLFVGPVVLSIAWQLLMVWTRDQGVSVSATTPAGS